MHIHVHACVVSNWYNVHVSKMMYMSTNACIIFSIDYYQGEQKKREGFYQQRGEEDPGRLHAQNMQVQLYIVVCL